MDDEVLAVIVAIFIVASVFAVVQAINAGRVVEPFSEIGLLGPDKKIGNYPKEVIAGRPTLLHVYIGNHEGRTMYYRILVKVGDKTSTINSSVPLNAEPIMELRAVLLHNTSVMIPVNVTLHEPRTNARLVFEMWIFNETSKAFTYYGRWTQLWINVTRPTYAEAVPQKPTMIPEDVSSMLAEGYISLRRAESSGGNVTEMVELLNRAILCAQSGEVDRAKELINTAISMEPEVSMKGVEASRLRLYTLVAYSSIVSGLSIGSYLYLRKRVWLLWLGVFKGRVVEVAGGTNVKMNSDEKAIKDLVRSNKSVTVKDLVGLSSKYGYKDWLTAKIVYKLARLGVLRLRDPNPPATYLSYMVSVYNLGFMIAVAIIVSTIVSIYLSHTSVVISYIRYALGSLFVLFLPGYSLVEALYPRQDELSPLERLALSIGLSLALVPLVGLILNYTPWGIRLDPIVVSLSALSIGLLLIASYRKFALLRLTQWAR